ncbi:hypothetical protein diail_1594, partial [Diaporthe ilicicola]
MDGSKQSKEIVVGGIEIKDTLVLVSPENALNDRLGVVVDNGDPLDLGKIAQATVSNPTLGQLRQPLLARREDGVTPEDLSGYLAVIPVVALPVGHSQETMPIISEDA